LTRTLARPIGNGTVEVHWARGKSPATRTRPPPSYWTACTTTHHAGHDRSPRSALPLAHVLPGSTQRLIWPLTPDCGNTSGE